MLHAPPLLSPPDPPPLVHLNAGARAPLLLVCDHAGRAIPAALGRLGVADDVMERHVAYDIGAAEVTRLLAAALKAPALLGGYSRLVIDLNRGLGDSTLIPESSDGIPVPGNIGLSAATREARIEALFRPWHESVAAELARLDALHRRPVPLFCIHSFTPVIKGFVRPWHVGVLWDGDGEKSLARPLLAALAAEGDLCVGDNEPYSGRDPGGGTLETHALDAGRPGLSIEIRQDLLGTAAGCAAWAGRLGRLLGAL